MKKLNVLIWAALAGIFACLSCVKDDEGAMVLKVYPDSVLNDVSNHPVGMNLNFLMDGDRFPDPERSVTEAMRDMGVRYLRYPGGEKSDLYLFSQPPWLKPFGYTSILVFFLTF